MSRTFVSGSSESLLNDTGIIDVTPATLAVWFNADNVTSDYTILWLGANNSDVKYLALKIMGAQGGDPVRAETAYGEVRSADTSAGYTASAWHHGCAVFAAANDRRVYLDGGNKGTSALDRSIGTDLDRVAIAAHEGSTPVYFDGTLAEAAVWNVTLTDAEVAILALGYSPLFVRSQSLLFYVPLIRDTDNDIVGGLHLTAGGTPTVSAHPPIIYPANVQVGTPITAGAALFASIADTIGITDTIETKVSNIRNISDNVGLTDVLSKIGTYIRTLADNLASTDTINTTRNLKKALTDDVGITDTTTTSKGAIRSNADTVGITDVISTIKGAIRSITDTVGITDILSKIGTFIRNVADTIGITDVIASKKFVLVALADTVGITDALSKIGTFIRSIPDNIGITDVLTKIGTYKRAIADTTGITDTTTVSKGVFRSLSDTIGITDVISTVIGKLSSIADTVGITDVITFIKTTVVGGRVFIAGIAKSLRISGNAKSLKVSGEDKSLKISGSGD